KLSTVIHSLSCEKSPPVLPGAPWTGADHVAPLSVDSKTSIPAPENCNVAKKMRPVLSERARTGSPASPFALVGNSPPSVQVAPLSVERDQPVNLLPAMPNEPESLKPTMTVLPQATTVFSLWVNWAVAVAPLLLLIRALT